ncbi:DUF6660 family protein [Flavobacterium sp.]|uniref:DUF6660 family protein n=1 Tax=Flavobacterium sp. TaxID=239 RepID=UPI003D6AD2EB
MKWFITILSIYLIALSCLPCADMEVNSLAHSKIDITADNDNHNHEKSSDMCSPFCNCNCCGVTFLSFQPTIAYDCPIVSSIIETSSPSYQSVFISNFYGSIWQPPQIV